MADLRFTLTSTTSQTTDSEGEGGLQPGIQGGAECLCILVQNLGPTGLIHGPLCSAQLMGSHRLQTCTHCRGGRKEC